MATIQTGRDPETDTEIIVIALEQVDYDKLRKGEGVHFGKQGGDMRIMIVDHAIHEKDLPADESETLQ